MDPSHLDGYYSVQEIWNLQDHHRHGHLCNVIGFISDFRPPYRTQGTSWKCTIDIVDHSIRENNVGLPLNVFWTEARMPSAPIFGDVIIVSQAKTQTHGGYLSLLASNNTYIFILPANEIPKNINDAAKLKNSWASYSNDRALKTKKLTVPSVSETKHAISMNNHRNEIVALTMRSGFDSNKILSKKKKEKFGLVQDMKANSFYNIIGEVRKIWQSSDQRASVYLSDYTSNSLLFDYTIADDPPDFFDQDGDEFNYTNALMKRNKSQIPGPYGKLILQITVWDEDAAFIKEHVKCGNWIYIKNIRIKLSLKNHLEGVVHGEEGKVHIQNFQIWNCPIEINKLLKAAQQRKKAWWNSYEENLVKERKKQSAEILQSKRKIDGENQISSSKNKNGKQRRKEKKAQAEENAARRDAKAAACLKLNENIQASHEDQSIVPLRNVLLSSQLSKPGLGIVYAPFSNLKYRIKVRVVDYFPDQIENFAIPCSETEIDGSIDKSELDDNSISVKNKWEWRFSLHLEDASNTKIQNKERVWVIVDNNAAQDLLNIEEDASDLRSNPGLLAKVKEQLFQLWGDLEEHKSSCLQEFVEDSKYQAPQSTADSETPLSPRNMNVGTQPDVDTDNEMANSNYPLNINTSSAHMKQRQVANSTNTGNKDTIILDTSRLSTNFDPSNKPFICCIQQYGVKVPEDDDSKANAGHKQRWQRLYGLFGTKILSIYKE